MRRFQIVDAEQRSPEWFAARLGRLTGSVAGDILKRTTARPKLAVRLALERLTGRSQESEFVSQAMRDGIEREPLAIAAYEAMTGEVVQRTGFLSHTELMAGCSLDGHMGDFEVLLSIKCRQPLAHWEFVETGTIPADALAQMRHEVWMTGAAAHVYFSWNPDFPEHMQSRSVRLEADALDIPGYDKAAREFLAEIESRIDRASALRAS